MLFACCFFRLPLNHLRPHGSPESWLAKALGQQRGKCKGRVRAVRRGWRCIDSMLGQTCVSSVCVEEIRKSSLRTGKVWVIFSIPPPRWWRRRCARLKNSEGAAAVMPAVNRRCSSRVVEGSALPFLLINIIELQAQLTQQNGTYLSINNFLYFLGNFVTKGSFLESCWHKNLAAAWSFYMHAGRAQSGFIEHASIFNKSFLAEHCNNKSPHALLE